MFSNILQNSLPTLWLLYTFLLLYII
jgi:hypothetical protein